MRYFILSYNDVCRIVKVNTQAPMSEIYRAYFGVPYGPKCLGSVAQWKLPDAIAIARESGFKEAWVNGEKQNIELVGLVGVN